MADFPDEEDKNQKHGPQLPPTMAPRRKRIQRRAIPDSRNSEEHENDEDGQNLDIDKDRDKNGDASEQTD